MRAYEYTEEKIALELGTFESEALAKMKKFPALLTHETGRDITPKLARVTDIERKPHAGVVCIKWEEIHTKSPINYERLVENSNSLDIGKWEWNRTHWAVKNVSLEPILESIGCGVVTPQVTKRPLINISSHRFNLAFSFPGTVREIVESIIPYIEGEFGPNSYFYDRNYIGELARPNHDLLLKDIYKNRSELVIVFLNSEYAGRVWCNTEWDAIRDSILERDKENRVMFIRTDDGEVPGVSRQDGYIDQRHLSPQKISEAIINRYKSDRLPNPIEELRKLEEEQLKRLRERILTDATFDGGTF